jgi:hypothetical protein
MKMQDKYRFIYYLKSKFIFAFVITALLYTTGCGRLWGGVTWYRAPTGSSTDILGIFVGAIGRTTATTGTCTGVGAEPTWCTGGTFGAGGGDGMFGGPGGVFADPVNGYLYVLDGVKISKVNLSTGAF